MKRLPPPQRVPILDSFAFRYVEKTIHQAIVQKLARILLEAGFLQEQAALQRMLDEFQEDVTFLSYAVILNDVTDLHKRYLDAFFEEEFDEKVRAFIARIENSGLDPSRGIALGRTISKAYSGYVHGASPQIMEMYGGNPPHFHVSGMRHTPRFLEHQDDLWNYFYRGVCAFGFAAKAFGDESLFASIQRYRDHGELMVRLERGRVTESFFGRNASFREEKNISFSAVGHLKRTAAGSDVTIFENVFAHDPLDYAVIPEVVKVVRIEVVANAA